MFPVQPSLRRTRDHLAAADPYRDVGVLLFSHGVDSIGLARPAEWRALPGGGRLLGVSERRFPADFPAFARYGWALRRDRPRHRLPDGPLPLTALDDVEAALAAARRTREG
jgi:hypothetical protein